MLSLYQYVDNAEWEELHYNQTEQLFNRKNKTYGAYHLRQIQSSVITLVLCSTIAVAGLAIFAKQYDWIGNANESVQLSEISDTTQFNLADFQQAPAPDPTVFNPQGENGDGQPAAEDGGTSPSEGKNPDANQTESPQKEAEEPKKKKSSSEQSIYEFEEELRRNTGGAAEREKILKEMEDRKKKREKEKQKQAVSGGNGAAVGSNAGAEGKTLASWNMNGRKPHLNNDDYIKIPGYLCGKGINVKVVVKVKVNSNGDVISAVSQSPAGTNPCCVEQAEKYAKKSRFEYASAAIQEGTITYTFQSQ